ncbi:hypothetical protein ADIS_2047 [Lunatimonas lonarensis]|uniref:Uncharacterized protein n=1 Tax=Lunatimonas lonarensis TaxID=1232681 RepID=R7ZTW1_9BACT|nr:hypothetical protein ADIS_2047 [Lunatimonas lonarensis]
MGYIIYSHWDKVPIYRENYKKVVHFRKLSRTTHFFSDQF